jgi:hypothetical protein
MRLLLALALLALLPASAAAQGPAAAGDYTGGGVGSEPGLVFLSVADDGRTFRGVFTVRAPCEAYDLPVQARIAIPTSQLADDGSATITRPVTGTARGPQGQEATESGEAVVTVQFDADDGTVTGGARLRSTFRDASGAVVAECDTGEQQFRAAILPSLISKRRAAAPRNASFVGGVGVQPMVASMRGGDIEQMTFLYRSGCQRRASGSAISRIVAVPELDLRPRVLAFTARGLNRLFSADGEEVVRFQLRVAFVRGGVMTGTIRYRGVLRNADDEVVARCDSGTLKFTAIALPR